MSMAWRYVSFPLGIEQMVIRVACFNIESGDVEDAPAPNALAKFDVYEKNGGVYIKGDEAAIRAGQRDPVSKCNATQSERVVVIGG